MQLPQAVTALSALGNGHRLAIFRLLVRAGPAGIAAGEVSREVGLLPNTLSTHLAALVHAGLAQSRRAGRSVLYSADYAAIRALLAKASDELARATRILYGGSVTPESFPELLNIPEVAGGLVGGASLDPHKFAALVKQAG